MPIKIRIYQVAAGDCIYIKVGLVGSEKVIMIDSGFANTYTGTIKKVIDEENEINCFVITHTDLDHIGGMIPFIKYFPELPIKRFIFNHSSLEVFSSGFSDKGIRQGLKLRDHLSNVGLLEENPILSGSVIKIDEEVNLKFLSPSKSSLEKYTEHEKEFENKSQFWDKANSVNDYSLRIKDLNLPINEDDEIPNGSSLAFILEYENTNYLFLGDAFPSIVCNGLETLGHTENNRLIVEYCKLSHHGSKYNISERLLDLIECANFIISTNGKKNNFPNKTTLAAIVKSRKSKPTNFIFNYDNEVMKSIFTKEELRKYNINLIFPERSLNYVEIQ